MRRNLSIGVQGKAVHTGTAGSFACRASPASPKPEPMRRTFLPSAFPKSDALLDRGRHGAGEFGFVVEQRIIPGGHSCVNSRFQVSQPAQPADDPPADFLDDVCNVGIAGRLDLDKAGLAARFGTIAVDALKEDDMKREMHIEAAAESLEKRDRSRLHFLPFGSMARGALALGAAREAWLAGLAERLAEVRILLWLSCLRALSVTLWFLGYPDQALQRSAEALALAYALSHPYS